MSFDAQELSRRGALAAAALLSSGVLVARGGLLVPAQAAPRAKSSGNKGSEKEHEKAGEEDVSATEDLMREHGILRRTLIVYSETARRLRNQPDSIDPAALVQAARLFRAFGENYHERILEEQYVFPEVRQAGGPVAGLVEVLLRQHQRGREITDYIERIGSKGNVSATDAEPLAAAMESMARMYNPHAAWEDTVVFPAWKKQQPRERLDELAEKFEEVERQQFGTDGFDDAVARIGRIEQMLGLADLDYYTAQSPASAR
jgi:hemerythrin-like domain-containing protein